MVEVAKSRAAFIFFDEVEIAPGELREIAARVDEDIALFAGWFVIARESQACSTFITNLVVATPEGDRRQVPMVPPHGIPSAAFSAQARALSSGFKMDVLNPALGTARITVRNDAMTPVRWSGEIEGRAIDKRASP